MGRRAGVGLLVLLLSIGSLGGNRPGVAGVAATYGGAQGPSEHKPAPTPEETIERMTPKQKKRLNQERYAEIRRDADKLLELANQLKRYVDNANENTLSVEVIRKAEEIEKLAKDVKSRMKSY